MDEQKKISLKEKIAAFSQAHAEWVIAGRPLRSKERVEEIYDNICSKCEHFEANKCNICGCNIKRTGIIFNKLAMATTKCPLPEPKWIEETQSEKTEKFKIENITPKETQEIQEIKEIQQSQQTQQTQQTEQARPSRGGCGCRG